MGDGICVDDKKDNCSKDAERFPDRPPRLLVGINRYGDKQNTNRPAKPRTVPPHLDGDDPILCPAGARYIGEILDHVAKGFAASEMALAWATDAGKDGEIGPRASSGEQALERDWAKLVTEMFVPNGYDMPQQVASLPPKLIVEVGAGLQRYQAQTYLYQRLQLEYVPQEKWPSGPGADPSKAARVQNTDPAYSLVTECQQFSTYILISRGFLVERDMKCCGVTAGAGSMACEMFQTRVSTERAGDTVSEMTITKRNANWIAYNVDPKFDDAKHAIDDLGLTPGSIYVFDKAMGADTSKQGDGSHVWPIIRIDSENSRFQNLDFGATKDLLPAPAWASAATPIAADLAKSGTAGDWLKRGYPPGHACGLGIAPKADRLPDAVKHLRRARPVGMGRLAIQRRLPPSAPGAPPTFRLVYLSSFIRMWGDGPEDNYHATRFLLSLRSTPYFEDLQAYWFLYAPKSYLAYVMWAEGHRHYHLSDFFVEALRYESAYGPQTGLGRTHFGPGDLMCPVVLTHDQMGFAKVAWSHDVRVTTSKPVLDANKKPALDKDGKPIVLTAAVTPVVDGLDPFFGGVSADGVLRDLGVRWDGEYFDPAIAPGGRSAPPFFDFEQVFVPMDDAQ